MNRRPSCRHFSVPPLKPRRAEREAAEGRRQCPLISPAPASTRELFRAIVDLCVVGTRLKMHMRMADFRYWLKAEESEVARILLPWGHQANQGAIPMKDELYIQEGKHYCAKQCFGSFEVKPGGNADETLVQIVASVRRDTPTCGAPQAAESTLTIHMDRRAAAQLAERIGHLLKSLPT